MNEQNYINHSRVVKGFHLLLGSMLLIGTIASIISIVIQWTAHFDIINPILIFILFACGILLFIYTRIFPIKAQDRAIRAEESLRYYILTRKPFDSKVTMAQIIALRFAPDEEFVILTERVIKENLSADEIKKEIKTWRADRHRV